MTELIEQVDGEKTTYETYDDYVRAKKSAVIDSHGGLEDARDAGAIHEDPLQTRWEKVQDGKIIIEVPKWLIAKKTVGASAAKGNIADTVFEGEIIDESEKAVKFAGEPLGKREEIENSDLPGPDEFVKEEKQRKLERMTTLDDWLPRSQITILRGGA